MKFRARAAELIIIKAGDLKLREIVGPYLVPAMGNKTSKTYQYLLCQYIMMILTLDFYHPSVECGEDVGDALKMKLAGNSMVTGFAQVMADGLTMAEASGKHSYGTWLAYEEAVC